MTKTSGGLASSAFAMLAMLGAGAAEAESFNLRIAAGHPDGPTVYVNDAKNFFVPEVKRRVSEETEHEIEFIEGYGGSMVSVSDTLEAVQSGIVDIGAYCFCFEASKLFLHNFPYYVPFGPQDAEQAMGAVRAVYDEVPWLTETFERDYSQTLLGLHGWDNYHLGTTMAWDSVEDLRNVKIGGAGPNLPWLEFVGSVPVQSTLPDGYMSLQTGIYNGWLMFPSAYLGFKFYEPAPNYTLIGFGAMQVNGLTMNTASLERLPPEVQQIIREVGRAYEDQAGASLNAAQAKGLDGLREVGAAITELGDDVRASWAQSLAAFPDQRAKESDGRGLPGTEVLNAYIAAIEAQGYDMPHDYVIE